VLVVIMMVEVEARGRSGSSNFMTLAVSPVQSCLVTAVAGVVSCCVVSLHCQACFLLTLVTLDTVAVSSMLAYQHRSCTPPSDVRQRRTHHVESGLHADTEFPGNEEIP